MEGSITIASCFEPGTVVKLRKAADPADLRPDASSIYVDKRTVDEKELVGFRGDDLVIGDLYFAEGLNHGRQVVVRARPEPVHVGSGELGQPTFATGITPIGTQEVPRVPDKPAPAPEHIGVGIQQEGEPRHPEFLDAPSPDTGAATESDLSPTGGGAPEQGEPPAESPAAPETAPAEAPVPPSPEPAPTTSEAVHIETTVQGQPYVVEGAVTETLPSGQTTPGPVEEHISPPAAPAAEPEQAPITDPEPHGPDLPALVTQAVSLGIQDNVGTLTVDQLRQAIRDKGQEPVA